MSQMKVLEKASTFALAQANAIKKDSLMNLLG